MQSKQRWINTVFIFYFNDAMYTIYGTFWHFYCTFCLAQSKANFLIELKRHGHCYYARGIPKIMPLK